MRVILSRERAETRTPDGQPSAFTTLHHKRRETVYAGRLSWSAGYGFDSEVTNQVFLMKHWVLALEPSLSIGTCSRTAANWNRKIWCLLYWVVYSVVINGNQPKQNLPLQRPGALPLKCMVSSRQIWSPMPIHRRTPSSLFSSASASSTQTENKPLEKEPCTEMTLKSSNKLRATPLEYNLKHPSNLKLECNPYRKDFCTGYVSNWFSLSAPRDLPRWRLVCKHGKSLKQLIPRLYYVLNSCVVFTIPPVKSRSQILPWLTSWIPPNLDRVQAGQTSRQQSMIIPGKAATGSKREHLGPFLSHSTSYPSSNSSSALPTLDVPGTSFPKAARDSEQQDRWETWSQIGIIFLLLWGKGLNPSFFLYFGVVLASLPSGTWHFFTQLLFSLLLNPG